MRRSKLRARTGGMGRWTATTSTTPPAGGPPDPATARLHAYLTRRRQLVADRVAERNRRRHAADAFLAATHDATVTCPR